MDAGRLGMEMGDASQETSSLSRTGLVLPPTPYRCAPPPESICCFVPPPPGCYVLPSHCAQEVRPPGRLNRPPPIDVNSIGNPPPPSHCGQEARPPRDWTDFCRSTQISSRICLCRQNAHCGNPRPPMPDPVPGKPAVSFGGASRSLAEEGGGSVGRRLKRWRNTNPASGFYDVRSDRSWFIWRTTVFLTYHGFVTITSSSSIISRD
jgi:hypothetical protein